MADVKEVSSPVKANDSSPRKFAAKVYKEVTEEEKKAQVIKNITKEASEPKIKETPKTTETKKTAREAKAEKKTEENKVADLSKTQIDRRKRGERGSPKREENKELKAVEANGEVTKTQPKTKRMGSAKQKEETKKETSQKPIRDKPSATVKAPVRVARVEDIKNNYKSAKTESKMANSNEKAQEKKEVIAPEKVKGKAPGRKGQARSPPSRINKTLDGEISNKTSEVKKTVATKIINENKSLSKTVNKRPQTAKPNSSAKKEEKKAEHSKTLLKFRSTKATELRKQAVKEGSPKATQVVQKEETKVAQKEEAKVVQKLQTTKQKQRISRSPGPSNQNKTHQLEKSTNKDIEKAKEERLKRVLESSQRLYKGEATVSVNKSQVVEDKKEATASVSKRPKTAKTIKVESTAKVVPSKLETSVEPKARESM